MLNYTYKIHDVTPEVIRVTYIPNDDRLETLIRTVPVLADMTQEECINSGVPKHVWRQQLYKLDTAYREYCDSENEEINRRRRLIIL